MVDQPDRGALAQTAVKIVEAEDTLGIPDVDGQKHAVTLPAT